METHITYYEYECGQPCTPNGCCGHETDIPVAIEINGFTLVLMGDQDDLSFLNDKRQLDHWTRTVEAICAAVKAVPSVEPNMELPTALDNDGMTLLDGN